MQAHERIEDARFRSNCVDAIHFWFERLGAELLDGLLVHAGTVEVADLLIYGAAFGVVHRGFFKNVAQNSSVALRQFAAAVPSRLVGWNRIVGHPQSAGVLVEVDT